MKRTILAVVLCLMAALASAQTNMLVNPYFDSGTTGWTVGAGWTWDAGRMVHAFGQTGALSQSVTFSSAGGHQVTIGMTRTSGAIQVCLGTNCTNISGGQTTFVSPSATGALTVSFTPTSDFDGVIDWVRLVGYFGVPGGNTTLGEYANPLNASYGNTAIGWWALNKVTHESPMNTAVGISALSTLTTGYQNQCFGYYCGGSIQTGNDNVGVGRSVISYITPASGSSNSTVGNNSLRYLTSGSYNSVIGYDAGYRSGASPATANGLTTGSNNTFIGVRSGYGSATQRTNATALGYESYVDADNTVALGDENVTEVRAGSAAQAKVATVGFTMTSTAFASLGTPANGTVVYCNDCANASNPCTGSSTSAIAKRLNGAWDCR